MLDTLKNLHPVVGTVVSFAEYAVLENRNTAIAVVAFAVGIAAKECFNAIRTEWNNHRAIVIKPATKLIPASYKEGEEEALDPDGKKTGKKVQVIDRPEEPAKPAELKGRMAILLDKTFWAAVWKPAVLGTVSVASLAVAVVVLK